MSLQTDKISSVATNIITGFLGAGKTSAIINLFKQKPAQERWAVLVNEFGEIGIDGHLLKSQPQQIDGVFISEVPGGCMCCAAGVPMQVALNKLLKEARPDRLLIEPTGLGHPKEVLQVLSSEQYQGVLTIGKTLTLVDARQLQNSRYTEHETFNEQIHIADTVVGNKADLYQPSDKQALIDYISENQEVIFAEQAQITLHELLGEKQNKQQIEHAFHHHHHHSKPLASELPMPESGMVKAVNQGQGFDSVGWRFAANKVFNKEKVLTLLNSLQVSRIKALLITDQGCIAYNRSLDKVSESALVMITESRIELINKQLDDNLESALLACID